MQPSRRDLRRLLRECLDHPTMPDDEKVRNARALLGMIEGLDELARLRREMERTVGENFPEAAR